MTGLLYRGSQNAMNFATCKEYLYGERAIRIYSLIIT